MRHGAPMDARQPHSAAGCVQAANSMARRNTAVAGERVRPAAQQRHAPASQPTHPPARLPAHPLPTHQSSRPQATQARRVLTPNEARTCLTRSASGARLAFDLPFFLAVQVLTTWAA